MQTTQTPKNGVSFVLEADRALPANCYTVTRVGVVENTTVSTARGPDPLRPWEPHIVAGSLRLHRDYIIVGESPVGAVYHPAEDGQTAVLRRAMLYRHEARSGKTFYTLRRPAEERPGFSLVKVDFGLPKGVKMVKGGHPLRIHAGLGGSATVIMQSNSEALVMISDGEALIVFFPDGFVREFRQQDGRLVEYLLKPIGMTDARIEDAHSRLVEVMQGRTVAESLSAVHSILSGMADLIHVTSAAKASAQDVRQLILKEFFLAINEKFLGAIHRKLTAILHSVDSALVPMILVSRVDDTTNVVNMKTAAAVLAGKFNVCQSQKSPEVRAKARAEADRKRKERSERDRANRAAQRGGSSGGSKKKSA